MLFLFVIFLAWYFLFVFWMQCSVLCSLTWYSIQPLGSESRVLTTGLQGNSLGMLLYLHL